MANQICESAGFNATQPVALLISSFLGGLLLIQCQSFGLSSSLAPWVKISSSVLSKRSLAKKENCIPGAAMPAFVKMRLIPASVAPSQSPLTPCLCKKPSIAKSPGKGGNCCMGAFPACPKEKVLTRVVQIRMKSQCKFHLQEGCSV